MLTFVVLVAAILLGLVIVIRLIPDDVMPLSCPSCYAGWGEDLIGRFRPWYIRRGNGRVRCRVCHTRFKEHPDGTLHRDPDML